MGSEMLSLAASTIKHKNPATTSLFVVTSNTVRLNALHGEALTATQAFRSSDEIMRGTARTHRHGHKFA